jgi:hypothetical protein
MGDGPTLDGLLRLVRDARRLEQAFSAADADDGEATAADVGVAWSAYRDALDDLFEYADRFPEQTDDEEAH